MAVAGIAVASCLVVLWQLRRSAADRRTALRAGQELASLDVSVPDRYEPSLVSALPEPAARFFNFAIEPGTRLATVVELTMTGELSFGTKEAPNYQPMTGHQILAAPYGFIWEIEAGTGLMQMSGSDGMSGDESWTRFWLRGVVPVVRAGGDADHLRSSFGRVVAEAAIWTPAFLLPRPGVVWSAVDSNTARVTVTHGPLTQAVDMRIDGTGQPVWVSMPRWTNANPEKAYRIQPFGGELSDFRKVSGYRVPFRVDGGNHFGGPDYFPFYKARLTDVLFHYPRRLADPAPR
jgi:hypothetical protein